MRNIILFDNKENRENLLPLTFTRPVADIRVGIETFTEKWQRIFPDAEISHLTVEYLRRKFVPKYTSDTLFIVGHVIPDDAFVKAVSSLALRHAIVKDGMLLAYRGDRAGFDAACLGYRDSSTEWDKELLCINFNYDIFMLNDTALALDYHRIVAGRESQPVSDSNIIIGDRYFPDGTPRLFLEEGAKMEGAIVNLTEGPVYIGKDAEVMEGACIRAPFAGCTHSVVNMGAKVYGATTLGPYCKVGGEVNNVVFIGYSNKAHDGFLGNAVIGEWCNIGGGTTASNLKNDYGEIKLWNYPQARFVRTGLQFCGLIMGDHTKLGVNTMINTATVLGVGVNIHGTGFPRNFVPSFSEGGSSGFVDVSLTKFFTIAERMMARRNKVLSEDDKEMFKSIYSIADNYK